MALGTEYRTLGNEIAVTIEMLDQVTMAGPVELGQAYQEFSAHLERLEANGRRVAKASTGLQKQSQVYTETWEAQIKEVRNPDIRALAMERNATVQERFEAVQAELTQVHQSYSQFEDNLKDISIVLEADLTGSSVDMLQNVIETAGHDAETAREDIQKIVQMLDWISDALAKPSAAPIEVELEDAADTETDSDEPTTSES